MYNFYELGMNLNENLKTDCELYKLYHAGDRVKAGSE